MRIAIFSDVHGNLTALQAVLQEIDEQPVDEIVFAGDLCAYGPRPQSCLALLQGREDIAAVYGNTDEWIDGPPLLSDDLEEERRERLRRIHDVVSWTRETLTAMQRAWLRELPFHRRISPTVNPHNDLLIVHANPLDVNQIIFPPEDEQKNRYGKVRQTDGDLAPMLQETVAGVLAFGHLHIPFIRSWGDTTLVNISSVSIPGDGDPRAKYAILEWAGNQWRVEHHRVSWDVTSEIEAYRQAQPPQWEETVAQLEQDGMVQQNV